ncbi:MAG: sugar phosphate isomerase/epimerase [Pirellulaceae bacterium]|nr:sugar phosphate isomerase/epimerase [Pirellulaceae bacterium]
MSSSLPRRTFLGSLTLGGVVASSPQPLAAIQPIQRTERSGLKLSLAAYSFRTELNLEPGSPGAMNLPAFIDYCASLGIEGTELTQYYFPAEVNDDFLFSLRKQAHLVGLDITGGAIGNKFTLPPGGELDKQMAYTKRWIENYSKLGAPVIRVFAGLPPEGVSEDDAIEQAATALRTACDYAGQHGVMLGIENHDFTSNVDRLLRIVEAVDSPWFGVNFDSGNFSGSHDPYGDMERMAPYSVNVQLKVLVRSAKGTEPADLPRMVDILRHAGYAGYLVLEYESAAPYENVPRYVDQLRKIVG